MASSAYDQSIRSLLTSKGVDNSKIGYNNGYVTVNGNNFMKADKTYNNTAFTNANNFSNAWNTYSQPKAPTASPTSAPAAAPAGMMGIRSGVQSSGYDPSSIGYSNGMVTVKNQPFITPSANVNGTTYTSPTSFNSAMGNFRINDLTNQMVNSTKLPENQYTPQINEQISYLTNLAKNQQNIDPYSTPEYAAYQAQADRQSQQGIRAAQESMGSSGFGRSLALGERAQGIQNKETEYLNTQVIPQIIAANQAKNQQQYQNLYNMLSPLMSQQGYADNRAQAELGNVANALKTVTDEQQRGSNNRRADAALTGTYLTPEQENHLNILYNLKSKAEAKGVTKDQRAGYTTDADKERNWLQASGLDISSLGANTNLATAKTSGVGRTIAGQQLDANKQDQQFNQGITVAQLTGYMPDGTATTTEQQRQLSNLWTVADQTGTIPDTLADLYGIARGTQTQTAKQFAAQLLNDSRGLDISQQNADSSSAGNKASIANSQFGQLLDVWQATGKAPSGLESYGVSPGTEYTAGAAAKAAAPQTYEDYQSAIEKVVSNNKKNPTVAQDYIKSLPVSNYEKYRAWIASGYEWPSTVEVPQPGE